MAGAVRLNGWTRLLWRLHRNVYGRLGGRVGTLVGSFPVLLLTTTGRKTGLPRTVTLNFIDLDEGVAVIGSYAGEPRDPSWALNVRANPTVTVRIGRDVIAAVGREVFGRERDRIAGTFEDRDRSYTRYRERTRRALPVFVFEATES
ncbi:MAG TPA: nitroreductase/quinone reductase family protein [Thermoleophilia bacterium]|nr:nitroreductase/quinone reductase family protein [Thermoleophilia bacterium]